MSESQARRNAIDHSVSARRWPKRLTPAERGALLLAVLADYEGQWLDVSTIRRVAATHGFVVGTGTTGAILQRLAGAGLCKRRQSGTTSVYRASSGQS
jgi:hypothetical protein